MTLRYTCFFDFSESMDFKGYKFFTKSFRKLLLSFVVIEETNFEDILY